MGHWTVNQAGKSIVLIGMMGAGKSSVGRCLQRRTQFALLDTDEIVASKFGLSIPEIFSKYGEQVFREAETEALREMGPDKQTIVVTGGGIVLCEDNLDFLKRLGVVVWLDGKEETLFERAARSGNRPLLKRGYSREAFTRILRLAANRRMQPNFASGCAKARMAKCIICNAAKRNVAIRRRFCPVRGRS